MAPMLYKSHNAADCRQWNSKWRPGASLFDGFCNSQGRHQYHKRDMSNRLDLISHQIQTTGRQMCTVENGTSTCIRTEPKKSPIEQLRASGHRVCGEENGSSACVDLDPKEPVGKLVKAIGDQVCTTEKGKTTCVNNKPKKVVDVKVKPAARLECTQELGSTTCIDLGLKKFVSDMIRAADDQESIKNQTGTPDAGLGPKRKTRKRDKGILSTNFEEEYQKSRMIDLNPSMVTGSYGPLASSHVSYTKNDPDFNSSASYPVRPQLLALSPLSDQYVHHGDMENGTSEMVKVSLNHQSATVTFLAAFGVLVFVLLFVRFIFYLRPPLQNENTREPQDDIELALLQTNVKSSIPRYADSETFERVSSKGANRMVNGREWGGKGQGKNELRKKMVTPRYLTQRMNTMETT